MTRFHVIKIKNRCRKLMYLISSVCLAIQCFLTVMNFQVNFKSFHKHKSRRLLTAIQLDEGRSIDKLYNDERQIKGSTETSTQPPADATTTIQPTISATTPAQPATLSPTLTITLTTYQNKTNRPKYEYDSNCEPPSVAEFPRDLFTQKQRRHGAFTVHMVVALYMFAALAVVCDYYFVPSLEVICAKLQLQSDVAGASLMAIGSSAPELFASIIGVFVTGGDLGIGTILGSAIFNVLFVLGLCGIVSTVELHLAWWPITRDGLCYAVSLIVLTVVMFDGAIRWSEAATMLLIYFAYLILMWKNQQIEKWFYHYIGDRQTYEERFEKINDDFDGEDVKDADNGEKKINDNDYHSPSEEQSERKATNGDEYTQIKQHDDSESSNEDSDDEIYPAELPRQLLELPSTAVKIIFWVLTFPIYGAYYFTIPDIRRRNLRHLVSLTFFMSILWIGVTTYILVWMVAIIGFTMRIPDAVMGLTFIAFGSSVPDALASILVARQGKGDMAVAQALGSNVFDVLLGLGFPWLLKIMIDSDSIIEVQSVGMIMSCFFIFLSVVGVLGALYYYDFKLSRRFGAILIGIYTIFLIASVLLEIYVWSDYHLPTCDTL